MAALRLCKQHRPDRHKRRAKRTSPIPPHKCRTGTYSQSLAGRRHPHDAFPKSRTTSASLIGRDARPSHRCNARDTISISRRFSRRQRKSRRSASCSEDFLQFRRCRRDVETSDHVGAVLTRRNRSRQNVGERAVHPNETLSRARVSRSEPPGG